MNMALGILFVWIGALALFVAVKGYRNLSGEGAGKYAGTWDFLTQQVYGPISTKVAG